MQNIISKGSSMRPDAAATNNLGNLLASTNAPQQPPVIHDTHNHSSNILNTPATDHKNNDTLIRVVSFSAELGKHHHISSDGDSLQHDRIEELKRHQGHEPQHLMMVLILVTVMILSQIGLVWWKSKYQKSYIHCSMIAMHILPFCISAYRHWWRFVAIWMVVTMVTVVLVWRPLIMPNFAGSGSTIPRLLYKWFFTIYSISSVIAVLGYLILVLTFFGINLLLNISPQFALDLGFMMLFYGIYYGVLCRDFTDFLVDRLAARIGYYNPTSALPSKTLRNNVCAICGMEHGNKEDIDIDGLTKHDTLLGNSDDPFDTDLHPDQEVLISIMDQDERLFVLTCGHKFHEYCIYGWCLVGKRQTCPFCREKVDLGRMFSALPFQKPHYMYGNLLEFIRYLFAWQPLIFLIVHFLDYELGLE